MKLKSLPVVGVNKEFIQVPLWDGWLMILQVSAESVDQNHGESGFGTSNSTQECTSRRVLVIVIHNP